MVSKAIAGMPSAARDGVGRGPGAGSPSRASSRPKGKCIESIACPVIGFFGLDDTNPSPADVDTIDAELTRHGKAHEFHRYAGAGHAFLDFANAERYRAGPGQGRLEQDARVPLGAT